VTVLDAVRAAFADPSELDTSPLYTELSRAVAADDGLVRLASLGRPGQYPTFLFFGAVHALLLAGADHPLARYYPSVAGAAARPPAGAGPALASFCREFRAELAAIISTRLVQTNVVQRAAGLRLGLAVIASRVRGPAHLVEVGSSAGLNLRFDRYGYRLAGRVFGDPGSPVQLGVQAIGPVPVPDLDRLPDLASVRGVDLRPVDATSPADRGWLEALVWPENHTQRSALAAALALVAADPPAVLAGDAIDVLPALAAALPPDEPRIVFHCATRMHVPAGRRAAFDAAIGSLGATGPLWRLAIEGSPVIGPPASARCGGALLIHGPDGAAETPAVVHGHLRWVEMLRAGPAQVPLTAS
jgi:hypothetical protein